MLTVLSTIVTLSLLITVHEFGHYQMARWCGVQVLRFSVGFGKPLLTKIATRDNTEFVISAIPLGGYVKMLDERELDAELPNINIDWTRAFNRQAVWKRMLIVIAGPLANLILAVLLYWVLFMHGVVGIKPILGEITKESPAAVAGLKPLDEIIAVNNKPVKSWQEIHWQVVQELFQIQQLAFTVRTHSGQIAVRQVALESIKKQGLEDADILSNLGMHLYKPAPPPVIGEVVPLGVASRAGLSQGDRLVEVDGVKVTSWDDFVSMVRSSPKRVITLKLQQGNIVKTITLVPELKLEQGQSYGYIGAGVDMHFLDKTLIILKYEPMEAMSKAILKTWDTSLFSLKMLGNMLVGNVSWKGVSGPVTIASYAGQSAKLGLPAFIGFLALISISLGVMNLLPIPILDGGHLLYHMAEVIKRSPVSDASIAIGQRVGISLLALMMTCALYNDITRLITD